MALFHKHQWEILVKDEKNIYEYGADPKCSLPIKRQYIVIQRCSICGKIKKDVIKI